MEDMRVTSERLGIAEAAFKIRGHFDADTLAAKLRRKRISRATVYRTIAILHEGGFLHKAMDKEGRGIYEHIFQYEPHGHLVCKRCGKGEGFQEGVVEDIRDRVCPKFGFEPAEYRIVIRGWCADCTAKIKKA